MWSLKNIPKMSVLILAALGLISWGFEPHRQINRRACLLLPEPMFGFFKHHIDFLTHHATDPDSRRYIDTNEAGKHFIDLEDYHEFCLPIDSIPQRWDSLSNHYSAEQIRKFGSLPWNIFFKIHQLKNAFKASDTVLILKIAADLGHYVADAHVPLHTTKNYNGQLTNQKGIHGLWETLVPKLFMDTILFSMESPHYLESPLDSIWKFIEQSHSCLPLTLEAEKWVKENLDIQKQQEYVQNGKIVSKTYSEEFIAMYHKRLNMVVEQRFIAAIKMVSNCWYTAWILAGEPSLPYSLYDEKTITQSPQYELEHCDH